MARYDPAMPMRVALLAAECEPWAKTGGLADVVDALARALGRLPEAGGGLAAPVDVLLPRYRSVPVPATATAEAPLVIADPRDGSPLGVTILDVAADGYRLTAQGGIVALFYAGVEGIHVDVNDLAQALSFLARLLA